MDAVTQQEIDDIEAEIDAVLAEGKSLPAPGGSGNDDDLDGPGKVEQHDEV